MLITKNKGNSKEVKFFNKKRKLTSTDGKVKERLEFSFYSNELKTFETYIEIIKKIVPKNPICYYDINFEELMDIVLKEEKNIGRAMLIE